MFHLQTLGRLELRTTDGTRVRAVQTRPKDLALLAYLAAAAPAGFVRRDTLLALFWPDLDAARGRNALNQGLHRLRGALAPGVLAAEGREDVGVSTGLSCDAVQFEKKLEAGEVAGALRLYGGDFLAGFHATGLAAEFDDWVLGERERLQRRAFNALLVLVDVEEKSGRSEAAIAWLRRALHMRPFDETICRRLIAALAAAGDRAGALAEYDSFARRLRHEYDLSPSVQTRAVPEAIRKADAPDGGLEKPRPRATDPRVVEAFLKGRYFTATLEHTARGLECLQRALALDADYAPAHAATAMSLTSLAVFGHVPSAEARVEASRAAARALELDPFLSDAHTAIAVTAMVFDWDWQRAEREFRIALGINPHSSDAHAYYAQFLCAVGRADEGVAEAEAAQQLDPLGPWANFVVGWTLFRARLHEASIERLRALLELYPHLAYAHLFLAENHVSRRAYAAAADASRTALEILPGDQLILSLTACVLGLSGEQDLARTLQRKLETLAESQDVCPGYLAAAHLGVGERECAFERWEAMCRRRSALAYLIPTDPLYDCVRNEDRFAALFERLGMPRPADRAVMRRGSEAAS